MKSVMPMVGDVAKTVLIALLIVVPIRTFVFQPFLVRGASMEPNFHNGDYLLVDQLSYRFKSPERGEVIIFEFPFDPSQRYIKRVIGLPGETVEVQDGKVIVYNSGTGSVSFVLEEPYLSGMNTNGSSRLTLSDHEYFVLGDNRTHSSDSRKWGVLPERNIIGRVVIRLFPVGALAKIEQPSYEIPTQ
ncbi:MAG: signal peptidase I [Candidatus Yanofskybacteria bacterium]|nr:signal peptidase I [Candidatus Yanofskybacteria bacterium]